MYSAVFFDFDGVILDSVGVKTQAFATLFADYGPEIQSAVVAYHEAKGGISRYEKFAYYYEYLLKQPLSSEKSIELGESFNKLALQGVLDANFILGALECLKSLKAIGVPAFVVSGTPHDEVNAIVDQRDLRSYFVEVHGSPRAKTTIVEEIAQRYDLLPSDCLFVGDAMTDYETASSLAMNFLGVVAKDAISPFPNNTTICHSLSLNVLIPAN